MMFNHSVLALAIAVAISAPALADSTIPFGVKLTGTGADSGSYYFNDRHVSKVGTEKAVVPFENFDGVNSFIEGYSGKTVTITGSFASIDIDPIANSGINKVIDNALELHKVTGNAGTLNNAASTYINTNGTSISSNKDEGKGRAIDINGSHLTAATTDRDGKIIEGAPVLIDNSGAITASNGIAISVENSTLTGDINNSGTIGVATTPGNGHVDNSAHGIKLSAAQGESTVFIGSIINSGQILGTTAGIALSATGTAVNADEPLADNPAKAGGNVTFTGNILNTVGAQAGNIQLASTDDGKVAFNGIIANQGTMGDIALTSEKPGGVDFKTAITNSGTMGAITVGDNTTFNGSITNSGTVSKDGTIGSINIGKDVVGKIAINLEEFSTLGGLTANQFTTTHLNGGKITGAVTNAGTFDFNGGTIKGVVANAGTFNFNGGSIDFTDGQSKVINTGSFNVKGKQAIAGLYQQTAGTLTVGLQKDAKIAGQKNAADAALNAGFRASSFDISAGKVNVDLQNSTYVQANDQFVVLGGDAATSIQTKAYLEGSTNPLGLLRSEFVSIKSVEATEDGLIVTFDRKSYTDYATGLTIPGQKGANVRVMLSSLDGIGTLAAADNQNAIDLLKLVDDVANSGNLTELLPDVSHATVDAAQRAAGQSNLQVAGRARSVASGDMLDNTGLWVQGIAAKSNQDNRHNDAYDTKSHGFVLGADTELSNGLVVGGAYSFINSDSNTANSNTDSDYHMATAYAAQAIGQVLLDGQAYYAWGDNDSRRNIGTTANYDSSLYGARIAGGYQFDIAPATHLIPTVSLDASRLSVDGYTEMGPAGLKIDSQNYNRLELGLNTELSKNYQLRNAMLTPSINVGVFHDFEGEAQSSTVAFATAPAETFKVTGAKPEKTRYVTGVGLDIVGNELLTVSIEYNYNWNTDGFDANSGALKFRWDF